MTRRYFRARTAKRSPFTSRDEQIRKLKEEIKKGRSIEFGYRPHEFGPGHCRVRVWRSDWPGDCFEVLSQQEFLQFRVFCDRFSLVLKEAEDD